MTTEKNLTNTNPSSNNQAWTTPVNTNSNNEEILDSLDIDLDLTWLDIQNENLKANDDMWEMENENSQSDDIQKWNTTDEKTKNLELDTPDSWEINSPKVETNSDSADNDRLSQENKKFEESMGQYNINENIQKQKKNIDLSDSQDLDLPFVWAENNVFKDKINENTEQWVQLDSLSDSFAKEKVENNTTTEDQETTKNTNTQNIDEPESQDSNISSNKEEEFQTNTGYIPNEDEFLQVQNLLNSNQTGNIDLSTLGHTTSHNNLTSWNLDQKTDTTNQDEWLNLDEIISNPTTNHETINIDQIIQSSQFEPIVIKENKQIEQSMNLTDTKQQIPAWTNVIPPVQVVNKKKKKGSGIKFFILILLLIVWWVMVLSKMYPEEIRQIITAIRDGNDVDIVDYEDENMENLDMEETDEVDENLENKEETDPNSLAWLIETENEENNDEQGIDSVHDSANDDPNAFNPFEGIDTMIQDEMDSNQAIIEQLKEYAQLGDGFNIRWRENNNTTAIKYWLYIKNHSERLLNSIENGEEINMLIVEEYIGKFDNYIQKLHTLTEGENSDDLNQQPIQLDNEQPAQTES